MGKNYKPQELQRKLPLQGSERWLVCGNGKLNGVVWCPRKAMEKVGFKGVPKVEAHSLNHLEQWVRGCLPGSTSINSVVCLWVRKNHLLLIIILNNSKPGGDGKPTQSSFQKDVDGGGEPIRKQIHLFHTKTKKG